MAEPSRVSLRPSSTPPISRPRRGMALKASKASRLRCCTTSSATCTASGGDVEFQTQQDLCMSRRLATAWPVYSFAPGGFLLPAAHQRGDDAVELVVGPVGHVNILMQSPVLHVGERIAGV